MNFKVFGTSPSGAGLQRIRSSPHYRNGQFRNIHPTVPIPSGSGYFKIWREFMQRPPSVVPSKPLPSVSTDLTSLGPEAAVTWFGHSSYLISARQFNVLVDPVFSGHASPFSSVTRAFPGSSVYLPEHMPAIDVLVLTHDHYDHLDFGAVCRLAPRAALIVAPLGVGAHLGYWGIPADKIRELDWWECLEIAPGVKLTATPARHFSGRTLKRNKTLWCSYVLHLFEKRLFLGGDSGYDDQFALIGKKYGPFDLALLECGQFGKYWPLIHMTPEQTVQAALDLDAGVLMPVHWGKFTLSTHPWNEPVKRAVAESRRLGQPIVTPKIGEPWRLGGAAAPGDWWEKP